MTAGFVSQEGRLLLSSGGVGFSIPDVIQTYAAINPGNSGVPLLNMLGKSVGINTSITSETGGVLWIGIAIPSSTITRIAPTLIENGTYVHPHLGLGEVTLASDIAQTINGSNGNSIIIPANLKGIYVDTVTKNGPADKAGIHGSNTDQYSTKHGRDIIVSIDVHKVTRTDDWISYIDMHKSVGSSVILTAYRDGHTLNLKTTLTSRPFPFLPTRSSPLEPPPSPPVPSHP
jgi:S1-C subfamily serine protease